MPTWSPTRSWRCATPIGPISLLACERAGARVDLRAWAARRFRLAELSVGRFSLARRTAKVSLINLGRKPFLHQLERQRGCSSCASYYFSLTAHACLVRSCFASYFIFTTARLQRYSRHLRNICTFWHLCSYRFLRACPCPFLFVFYVTSYIFTFSLF